MMSNLFTSKQQIFLVKVLHSLVVLFMAFCVMYVWYSVITDTRSPLLWILSALVLLEGVVWWFSGRKCPLTKWAQHLGDETGNDLIADYILPQWMIPRYLPICAVLFVLGYIAMGIITLI